MFENKLDGFRALVRKTRRAVELLSRSGRSMEFPDVVEAARAIPGSAIVDAELVVLGECGHAMFERIRRRAVMRLERTILAAAKAEPALLCVFDVLAVGSRDVRPEPLLQRKERLAKLMPSAPGLYLVPHLATHGGTPSTGRRWSTVRRAWSGSARIPRTGAGIQPTWRKVKNPDFYRKEALGIRS